MFVTNIQSLKKVFRLSLTVIGITMLLSACSIPIPLGDLLPELGSSKSGTFVIPNISKSGFDLAPFLGESKAQSLVRPTEGLSMVVIPKDLDLDGPNPVINLTNQDEIQSKLVSVDVSFKLLLNKVGDYSTSDTFLQAYLAPDDGSDIIAEANNLGQPIKVNFVNDSQTVESVIKLNSAQIKAINERKLRIGFGITGTINDIKSATAGLSYDIQSLKIIDLKVNVNERFPTGANGDVISIAKIDTGIAKVSSLTLDYGATIKQSTPIVLKGTATVKLYLASVAESNLYQDSNLIKSIDIDVSGDVISGQLTIQNPLVAIALTDSKIRYGVTIEGSSIGIEAVAGNDTAVTFEYEITKLNGTAGVGL